MSSPSNPSNSPERLPVRLLELEEAWLHDTLGTEALDELKQINRLATNGADKHLAFCPIERLENRPPRHDGEVQRLLQKRDNIRWNKKLIFFPSQQTEAPT